jgi:hypothetical protein
MDVVSAIAIPVLMGVAVVVACFIENVPKPRPRP